MESESRRTVMNNAAFREAIGFMGPPFKVRKQ
jgi:hypothetical protein